MEQLIAHLESALEQAQYLRALPHSVKQYGAGRSNLQQIATELRLASEIFKVLYAESV